MKTILSFTTAAFVGTLLLTGSPVYAADTDSRIESSAAKSYVFKTYLKDDSIKTEAKNGIVTLTGTVAEVSHRSLAEDTVAGLPGVTRVDNQLAVRSNQPAEHSDTWITTKVKTMLLFHRNVSASGTTVTTKDGVVTLQGVAPNLASKELTGEYAKDIDNVKEVKNEMTVATASNATVTATTGEPESTMGDKIDDASITAQVKLSLLSHRSTSALHTTVTTTDGVVTLGGVAKNEAEKSLVTKLASDIRGVTSVNNKMTIGEPMAGK